ncbi:MAG: DUF421 domain-containing protein [Oscillospiraceae bacterium]|jgi:uncharacterized membrane protein YcaP (DUF421 family)|nr:DUF421 domain-containing protein [Oscillospiraceae bacterium]
MHLLRSVGYTAILYLIVVIAMRLLGKRHIGDMQPSEFAVTILLSEMATIPLQDPEQPLLNGIIPILVLLAFELSLSFGFIKNRRLWRLFEGKETILVRAGTVDERALRRNRVTLNELFEMLRLQGFTDLSQLKYAIFETNGQLSVIPYEAHKPATPADLSVPVDEPGLPQILISDGRVMPRKLDKAGLTDAWLQAELTSRGFKSASEVFVLTRDECGRVYCVAKQKGTPSTA